MKKHFLMIPALAVVLASCGGQRANQNQESKASNAEAQTAETTAVSAPNLKKVNWDKPMFALDEKGDTTCKWIYNDKGQLIEFVDKLMGETVHYTYDAKGNKVSSDMMNGEEWTYDEQGREATYHDGYGESPYWKYEYEGNIRKVTESSSYGPNHYYRFYYLDKDMKYDTLSLMTRESFDNEWEYKTVKKYVDILGKKYLSEETEYYQKDGTISMVHKTVYEYNNIGAITKITFTNQAGEVDVTETQTEDNWRKTGATKTYYSWK